MNGTKAGANSNPHKVVWAKKTERYKQKLQEQIERLLDEIEQVNERENEEYGEESLEELGEQSTLTAEKLKQKVAKLNEQLQEKPEDLALKKAVKQLEQEDLPRLQKYEEQERLLNGRNSYSKTDPDASSLRMKEDRAARKPLKLSKKSPKKVSLRIVLLYEETFNIIFFSSDLTVWQKNIDRHEKAGKVVLRQTTFPGATHADQRDLSYLDSTNL